MYATFLDGRVYCIAADPDFAQNYYLNVGSSVYEFEAGGPVLISGLIGNLLLSSQDTAGWQLESGDDVGAHYGFDLSQEWTLEGKATLFVECDPYPGFFKLVAKSRTGGSLFRVQEGLKLDFSAHAACHRCEGKLCVEYYDVQRTLVGNCEICLPTGMGGRNLSGYHMIKQSLITPAGSHYVEFSIQYNRPVDPVSGFRSFIFVANIKLHVSDDKLPSLDITSELLGVKGAGVAGSAGLYSAPVFGQYISSGIVPKVSVVPRDTSDGRQAYMIDHPRKSWIPTNVSLEVIEGLFFRIGIPLGFLFSIFLDGARIPDDSYYLHDADTNIYKLNNRYNDGGIHHIQVRDVSGCLILAEEIMLLPFQQTPWHILQEHGGPSLPISLSPLAGQRYASLLANLNKHARDGNIPTQTLWPKQLEQVHNTVVRGFAFNNLFAPLEFPTYEFPDASIVIPVRNKMQVTYFCLAALLLAYNDASFEVIVVDDGSTDETSKLSQIISGITVVANPSSQGFVRSCNRGADLARGKYVVFLNNDTEPSIRWLDELISAFGIFDDVGLVGSKLIYPDGRLQEAGGIVWNSGNPWNYGRLGNPFDSRYSYTRDVDYLSGAAIMLPVAVWKEVGGFSSEFAPAYFEDTDLAFKVRNHGFRTMFVAPSVVYHFEGVSSGTDVAAGAKRFQEVNRPLFKLKWRSAFSIFGEEGKNVDLEKDRGVVGRVLFLDYTTPRENMDAGSYAAIQEMKLFQKLGYKVTFFPQNAAYLGEHTTSLQRRGVEVLHAPFYLSIEDVLSKRGSEFDAIYITRYYVGREAIPLVRRYASRAKILFCLADLHFLRLLRAALRGKNDSKMVEAVETRNEELLVIRNVDATLSYNEVEQAVILSHDPGNSKVMRLPWVEKVHELTKGFDQRTGLAFLGSFNHFPNLEAMEYFIQSVMPLFSKSGAEVDLHVYGSNMPESLKGMASSNLMMHGFVEDLRDVYNCRKIFIAPLLSGAGLKGKVLGALARGIPCVLSPLAAEGIGVRHGYDCMIAESPSEWVASVQSLLQDSGLWITMSARGQDLVQRNFSEQRGLRMMRGIVEAMDLPFRLGPADGLADRDSLRV